MTGGGVLDGAGEEDRDRPERAHAYQACVLSVLMYGLPLWYTFWGTGVIRLVKRMERVHSYTLGWVIGAFRTSPVGSRELIAGIPLLKVILNMRIQGMIARLPPVEEHTIFRPTTLLRGSDLYADRLFFDLTAPKRASKFFNGWVCDFEKKINALMADGCSLVFSDGAFWSKTSRASYAFTAFHNNAWHDTSGWCPAGSSFDAELAALEEALQWTLTRNIPNPIFFIDNKSVLMSFLDLDTHSSQSASIRINLLLHDFLSTTDSTISFAYCPSHVGIEGNE
ncbi:hypothetical protein AX14_003891 [Amanita brunnescens Koide BX004]|nr:hypothetical protein AX14_003891 [Amanita brunnescens Koide BX004]